MNKTCIIVGGGYTGLSAAFELARAGVKPLVFEADSQVGGLAGSFDVGDGVELEKFYHHWFTSDTHISDLVADLGQTDCIVYRPTNTGMYYANRVFRLSTPLDLLKFSPLKFLDRLRMGRVALAAAAYAATASTTRSGDRCWRANLVPSSIKSPRCGCGIN
jgi:protoporphyrinogen oxidase